MGLQESSLRGRSEALSCAPASCTCSSRDNPEVEEAPLPEKSFMKAALEGLDGALAFLNMGMRKQRQGSLEGALAAFREALQIRVFMLQSASEDESLLRGEDLHSALFLCREALEISECIGTQLTPEGAFLTGIYAVLLHLRGDVDHALSHYPQALQVLEELGEEHCHVRAVLLGCLGDARSELGYHRPALVSFMEAHQVRLVKRTLQTVEGALLMISIGLTKFAMDDSISALEAYSLAVMVFDALGGVNTNTFAVLLNFIGMAKYRCGDYMEATETLKKAHGIRKSLDSLDTSDGRHLIENLHRAKRELQKEGLHAAAGIGTPRSGFGTPRSGMGTPRSVGTPRSRGYRSNTMLEARRGGSPQDELFAEKMFRVTQDHDH